MELSQDDDRSALLTAGQLVLVLLGAAVCTVLVFFMLPLIQAMSPPAKPPPPDIPVDAGFEEPPPDVPEEEEQPPEPEEPPEPELSEETPPMDLDQLELALNPGFGSGFGGGGYELGLKSLAQSAQNGLEGFGAGGLDQVARPIYAPPPQMTDRLRKKGGGNVYLLALVDERGRVQNVIVQSSSDPEFEAPAIAAVRKWKFEPATRNGKAVADRVRVPITFPRT
ncbi:MAG: energy transducer TonB [Planctomycetota bacterium]|jgi:protein TonB